MAPSRNYARTGAPIRRRIDAGSVSVLLGGWGLTDPLLSSPNDQPSSGKYPARSRFEGSYHGHERQSDPKHRQHRRSKATESSCRAHAPAAGRPSRAQVACAGAQTVSPERPANLHAARAPFLKQRGRPDFLSRPQVSATGLVAGTWDRENCIFYLSLAWLDPLNADPHCGPRFFRHIFLCANIFRHGSCACPELPFRYNSGRDRSSVAQARPTPG